MVDAQREADDCDGAQVRRGLGDPSECGLACVDQRSLMEKVVTGVGRESELGKGDEHRPLVGCPT